MKFCFPFNFWWQAKNQWQSTSTIQKLYSSLQKNAFSIENKNCFHSFLISEAVLKSLIVLLQLYKNRLRSGSVIIGKIFGHK